MTSDQSRQIKSRARTNFRYYVRCHETVPKIDIVLGALNSRLKKYKVKEIIIGTGSVVFAADRYHHDIFFKTASKQKVCFMFLFIVGIFEWISI